MQNDQQSEYQLADKQLDNLPHKHEQLLPASAAAGEEGMILQLADGSIQACNAIAERILKVTIEQMQGWTSLEECGQAIHEDGSPFSGDIHPAMVVLRTGKPCLNAVMGLYQPNGELIWLSIDSQPLFRANQAAPYAVVTTFADISAQKWLQSGSDLGSITEQEQPERPITQNEFPENASMSDRQQLEIALKVSYAKLERRVKERNAELQGANAALAESEQRLRTALEAARMGTWNWNILTNQISWSPNLERLFGMEPGSFEGRYETFVETLHPNDRERVLAAIARAIDCGEGYDIEFRVILPDGKIRWAASKGQVLYDETGRPIRMVGVDLDITVRKEAEEALRRSEEFNRRLLDSSNDCIKVLDLEGRLLYMSPGGQRLMEIDEIATYLNGEWVYFWESGAGQAALEAIATAKAGGVGKFQGCCPTAKGTPKWWEVVITPIYNATGQVERLLSISRNISDRRQAEEALRESQQRLQAIFNHTFQFMGLLKPEGTLLEANQTSLNFAGVSANEVIGRLFWETPWWTNSPESQAQLRAGIAAAASGKFVQFETTHTSAAGIVATVDFSLSPVTDETGQVVLLVPEGRNISDRKHAEQALKDSEERLRSFVEANVIGILFGDIYGGIGDANDELLRIVGYTREDLRAGRLRWIDITPPEYLSLDEQRIAEAQATGACTPYEKEYIRKDGSRVPVLVGYSLVGEKRQESVAFILDLSERKRIQVEREQMLVRSQQYTKQLHGLTEAALAINSALSIEEVLQVITEQARFIIGAHQSVTSMTIDQNWAQAINAVSLSDKYAQWRDYNTQPDGSGIYTCVCHMNRPMRMTQAELEAHPRWHGFGKAADKHPPMRGWLAAPLVGRDGRNIGLIQLSDKYEGEFTADDEAIIVQLAQMASVAIENTQLYEAAQVARTQAEAANRIKDEFLAVLSHELRSPLNPILGWTKLLQSRKFDAAKTAEALAIIERNARLQAQLIEELLDVSRILQGKLTLNVSPVSLASTIAAAIETVRLAADAKAIQIQTAIEPNVGQVTGDPARLQQVLWNLLSNAVKFTPSGGRVEIRLSRVMGNSQFAIRNSQLPTTNYQPPTTNYAQIQVIDTGKGIHPDFLPYVFDYFRQADSATTRKFGGLGLGLAIARQLVEMHGGTILAESPGEEQGATFTVKIPLLEAAEGAGEVGVVGGEVNSRPSIAGLQILIVDDEVDSREFVTFVLSQDGAETIAVSSASEALQVLAQSQPDVIVSDIGMPEIDGYMLMRQIRTWPPEQGGQIPAIALTAYAGEYDQKQALSAGFQVHVPKPVDPAQLVAVVARLAREAISY